MAKTFAVIVASTAAVAGAVFLTRGNTAPEGPPVGLQPAGNWLDPSVWQDGLVEKATYDATKVIYGEPRAYEAIFLTNAETHEAATWTKSPSGEGSSVWKHNQIEVIPTPNYDYKFVTTSHLDYGDLSLTRIDAGSQEWCGSSFRQLLRTPTGWNYWESSYMPGNGRSTAEVSRDGPPVIPFNALPLALRAYDFAAKPTLSFRMIPDLRSNRAVDATPIDVTVTHAEETEDGHVLTLSSGDTVRGTFTFAKDRGHVMLSYRGDGQTYELRDVSRVNYWTLPKK
jgi:hypothetical protein